MGYGHYGLKSFFLAFKSLNMQIFIISNALEFFFTNNTCFFFFSLYLFYFFPRLPIILLNRTNRDYRSISEFFTRSLKPDVRSIHSASCLVSPVDGTVLHFGLCSGEQIEQVRCALHTNCVSRGSNSVLFWNQFQVKGINYSLDSFIGPPNENTGKYLDSFRKNKNTVRAYLLS